MPPHSLTVGDHAPGFQLPDQAGATVSLEDLLGDGPVVLMFVPRPTTGVCAKTACGLRKRFERLQAQGAQVVGISPMSREVHDALVKEHRLPFRYLTDEGGKVAKQYGVRPFLGFLPGRATFVLDAEGVVRRVERSAVSADKHIEAAVEGIDQVVLPG